MANTLCFCIKQRKGEWGEAWGQKDPFIHVPLSCEWLLPSVPLQQVLKPKVLLPALPLPPGVPSQGRDQLDGGRATYVLEITQLPSGPLTIGQVPCRVLYLLCFPHHNLLSRNHYSPIL